MLFSIIIIYQYIFMDIERPPTFMNAVHGGFIISLAMGVNYVYILLSSRNKNLLFLILTISIFFFAIIINQTRGAIFGFFNFLHFHLFCLFKIKKNEVYFFYDFLFDYFININCTFVKK